MSMILTMDIAVSDIMMAMAKDDGLVLTGQPHDDGRSGGNRWGPIALFLSCPAARLLRSMGTFK